MINQDDEEDTSNSVGATRYPCMPSLVAMQQMRNRLNLAYLGKKLMKWSAMATGRELRRISHEIHGVYDDYRDDSRNGYIVLARARYFYPNLNSIVIENVPKEAQVSFSSTTKTVSGVRVIQYFIEDSGKDAYEHLGIERGGQSIKEAKRLWNNLLKRMIMILELRMSFTLVEQANKSATKNKTRAVLTTKCECSAAKTDICHNTKAADIPNRKMNVLGKIVIPKTIMSLEYIAAEMEEKEREEFFRLKKIIQIKYKQARARYKRQHPDEFMNKPPEQEPTLPITLPEPIPLEKPMPTVVEEKRCIVCNELISGAGEIPLETELVGDSDLEAYKSQLTQLAKKTKEVEAKVPIEGISSFLKTVEEMKQVVDFASKTASAKYVVPPDVNVEQLCPKCKSLYDDQNIVEPEPESIPEPKIDTIVEQLPEPESIPEPRIDTIVEQPPEPVVPTVSETSGLGTYEEETKVITRVLRKKNPDGSITEEKRVLKVKKIVKDPSVQPTDEEETGGPVRERSGASSKSNPYAGSNTIGLILVNESNKVRSKPLIKSHSEIISSTMPIGCPVVRYCLSLGNLNSSSCEETISRGEVSQGTRRFINSVLGFNFNRKSITSSFSDSLMNTKSKKDVICRSHSC